MPINFTGNNYIAQIKSEYGIQFVPALQSFLPLNAGGGGILPPIAESFTTEE